MKLAVSGNVICSGSSDAGTFDGGTAWEMKGYTAGAEGGGSLSAGEGSDRSQYARKKRIARSASINIRVDNV